VTDRNKGTSLLHYRTYHDCKKFYDAGLNALKLFFFVIDKGKESYAVCPEEVFTG
jgi:hypothetical protein